MVRNGFRNHPRYGHELRWGTRRGGQHPSNLCVVFLVFAANEDQGSPVRIQTQMASQKAGSDLGPKTKPSAILVLSKWALPHVDDSPLPVNLEIIAFDITSPTPNAQTARAAQLSIY